MDSPSSVMGIAMLLAAAALTGVSFYLAVRTMQARRDLLDEQLAHLRTQQDRERLEDAVAGWRKLATDLLEAEQQDDPEARDAVCLAQSRRVVTATLDRLAR